MKCTEAQQLVQPYIEKKLSDRDMERFLDHVQSCADCFDELEIYFSIYEALGNNEKATGRDEYDFKRKLKWDIESKRRYLRRRKFYHTLLMGAFALTGVVMLLVAFTGFEMWGGNGIRSTTIYRIFYGNQEPVETETEIETESQTGPETDTSIQPQGSDLSQSITGNK